MSFQWVESVPEQAPQDLSLPQYQVLVADDDSTIRYNVKDYFTLFHQAPYRLEIDQAATGEDAIEKLKAKKYDLIICDINLPDIDGFEVIKQGVALYPDMKRAMITAYNLDEYMRIVKEEKVYNIITKTAPFNYEELATVVNNLLIPESAFGLEKYMKPDAP
jgi:CheY-like chemotaxis protein